ncbi:MAG: cytochrome c3 family protein [Candidatus Omnitrophica bacterium]|nr:cytochrome c3 family protein [Candidatus Omnitrophota bacterium]
MNHSSRFWISIALFIIPLAGIAAAEEHPIVDCAQCHTCLHPTSENPCLQPCPRPKGAYVPLATQGPDVVILDELKAVEDLYVPVRFNHATHAHMSSTVEGCQMCHHYNEKGAIPASCKSCHPVDIIHENIAQPGLKGAYHRQCVGCHTQWDRNTDCVICHEKKSGGPLHGTAVSPSETKHYPPVRMRDLIIYNTNYEENDQVPFHHKTHAYKYDRNCGDCHQQQGCEACHDQYAAELKPMGNLTPEAMHDHCFVCHENDTCEHCHGRDPNDVFNHAASGWPLKIYHDRLHCLDCHIQRGNLRKLDNRCTNCHIEGWKAETFDHTVTGVALDEVHRQAECVVCHEGSMEESNGNLIPKAGGVAYSCAACHDDDRKYTKEKGFGGS